MAAKRTARPKNALVVRQFAKLEQYAERFAQGFFNLLILIGRPGVAKSQTVRTAVGNQALWIEGSASAFGIYCQLYENRERPVVIDDVDELYRNQAAVRLLKSLCDTNAVKTVSWNTAAAGTTNPEVPQRFSTTSKVTIIANDWKTLSANVQALENRGRKIFFDPAPEEVHRKVGDWFWDQEIYNWFGENLHLIPDLSMRDYLGASELKEAGMDWFDTLQEKGLSERTMLVAKLLHDTRYDSDAQRIQAFRELGGGARSTYFLHKKRLTGTRRRKHLPERIKLKKKRKHPPLRIAQM